MNLKKVTASLLTLATVAASPIAALARPAAESALKALQSATAPEKQIVTDINNYCSR